MSNQKDLLFPLGGGNEIGASSYLLQVNGKRVLIDAGLRLHGPRAFPDYASLSQIGLMGLYECDCVCITHAHLDHVGSLPAVYYETRSKSYDTPIYATRPSIDIASVLLNDTVKIKRVRGEYVGDIEIHEFEKNLVQETVEAIQDVRFNNSFNAASGIKVTYFPAGHILGAAMILFEIDGFRALFTGDFCGDGQNTISGYRLPEKLPDIDLMVCESTYAYEKSDIDFRIEHEKFIEEIESAIVQGGKVLIPAFAVGRSQEVIMLLRQAKEFGRISVEFPVYTDGMVNQVCEIYDKHRSFLSKDVANIKGNLFFSNELGIQKSLYDFRKPGTADRLRKPPPCCIIASSGMLADGSRSSDYAKVLIGDPRNKILFTGYLDEESPGHQLLLQSGRKLHKWKECNVAAQIVPYRLSAHAPLEQITKLVERVNPRQVVFIHGDADKSENQDNFFSNSNFFRWGKCNIRPHISRNQDPIYLG